MNVRVGGSARDNRVEILRNTGPVRGSKRPGNRHNFLFAKSPSLHPGSNVAKLEI